MSLVERIKLGGSTITYLIVGAVLVVGLIGLVCVVKQRGNLAREEQATIAYEEQQKDNQATNDSKTNNNTETETNAKADNKVVDSSESQTVSDNSLSDLPQTGPRDVFLNAGALFILTLSVTNYLSSRQRRISYL